MAERFFITVRPSGHPDMLEVRDAMQQVLDYITLLSDDDDQASLVWGLAFASTNSPTLRVEAEAISVLPDVDVTIPAKAQKRIFGENMRALVRGNPPPDWVGRKYDIAINILKRNSNGIGRTEIALNGTAPEFVVDESIAREAISRLKAEPEFPPPPKHTEIGTIEGVLIDVTTYYDQPAIKVRERRGRKDVTCIVSTEIRQRMEKVASASNVWDHRFIRVHGRIAYDHRGRILQLVADDATVMPPPPNVTYHDLYDPDFTGGLSVSKYLDDLREGQLGD